MVNRFVWVKYLIEELCLQFSDEDIRKALESLPKDLEETFNRALLRILSQNAKVAPRVFLCIAVATRHLSLIEILEAISIKVGEGSSSPARRINNKYSIIALCGNLLHVNEEDETVQFAHRSVFDYVTGAFSAPQLAGFHINMEQADHHAGELCVTYLLWSNFQTTLARRADNSTRLRPDAILSLVLGREGTMEKIARTFMRSRSTNSLPSTETYVVRSLEKYMVNESETAENMVEKGHPFLKYARKYWITHTAQFQRGISSMWEMWRGIVFHDLSNLNLDHVQRPAEFEHLDATSMWIWAQEHRYFALIRVLVDTRASDLGTAVQDLAPALIRSHDWEMSVAMLKQQDLEKLAFKLVEDGDWVVLDAMLDKMLKQWSLGDDFLRHILNAATNRAQHDERLKFINLWCPVVLYMTIFFVVGVVLRYRSSISETTCGYWIWFRMDKYVAKQ